MKIKINDVELYYEVHGTGRPLIMLHGNGENHNIFNIACNILEKYYQVYLIDSRGHGLSSKIKEYHYQDMANDIKEFIETFDLKDVIVYGYSDGGIVGLLLSYQYPDLVKDLIISGANLNPTGVTDECYKGMKEEYKHTKSPLIKLMIDEPNILNKHLKLIKANTLVLTGEYDVIKKEQTNRIINHIPNAVGMILENEDHGSYICNSDKIAYIIIDYLNNKPF